MTRINALGTSYLAPQLNAQRASQHTALRFGSLLDGMHPAKKTELIAVVNKDYGAGVTGKDVLDRIVKLIDKANEKQQAAYAQALAQHKAMNPWDKVFTAGPDKPLPVKGISFDELYEEYAHPDPHGGFHENESVKAAHEALQALYSYNLISSSSGYSLTHIPDYRRRYYSYYMSREDQSLHLTQLGQETLDELNQAKSE